MAELFAESTVEDAALSWRVAQHDALLPACSADRPKLLSGEIRVKSAERLAEANG